MGRKPKEKLSYDEAKDAAIEKVILHLRNPRAFGAVQLTLEEIAILLSPDENHVLTKMAWCKVEKRALGKLKAGLSKYGINSLADAIGCDKRETVDFGA